MATANRYTAQDDTLTGTLRYAQGTNTRDAEWTAYRDQADVTGAWGLTTAGSWARP
jgi:hypothetical protein